MLTYNLRKKSLQYIFFLMQIITRVLNGQQFRNKTRTEISKITICTYCGITFRLYESLLKIILLLFKRI